MNARSHRPTPRPAVVLLVVLLASLTTLASGCLYVGGQRPVGGWQTAPRQVDDDWRQLGMQELMAYSDTWFVVDSQQRGTVKGFASGGAKVAPDGGYFELSVISRQNNVPVEQTVRVFFDRWTPVYIDGSRAGTVLEGLSAQKGYDVSRGGRILEVPFNVNGGRLFAERVDVSEDAEPQVP